MRTPDKTVQERLQALNRGERLAKMQTDQKRLDRLIRFLNPKAADEIMKELLPLFDLTLTEAYAARSEVYEPAMAEAFRKATLRMPARVALVEMGRILNCISDQQAEMIWNRNWTGMRLQENFPQVEGPLSQAVDVAVEIVGPKIWKCLRRAFKKFVFTGIEAPDRVLEAALQNVFLIAACWTAFALKGHVGAENVGPLFRFARRSPFIVTYANEWNAQPHQQPLSLTFFIR